MQISCKDLLSCEEVGNFHFPLALVKPLKKRKSCTADMRQHSWAAASLFKTAQKDSGLLFFTSLWLIFATNLRMLHWLITSWSQKWERHFSSLQVNEKFAFVGMLGVKPSCTWTQQRVHGTSNTLPLKWYLCQNVVKITTFSGTFSFFEGFIHSWKTFILLAFHWNKIFIWT